MEIPKKKLLYSSLKSNQTLLQEEKKKKKKEKQKGTKPTYNVTGSYNFSYKCVGYSRKSEFE